MAAPRWPLFPSPSLYVSRRAMVEGRRGRSQFWRVVMFAILARRLFQRVMRSQPRTIAIERIKPGETVILRGVRSRDVRS